MIRNGGKVSFMMRHEAPPGADNSAVTIVYEFWHGDIELMGLRRWQINNLTGLEGVKWCYGWSGPAVDALLAACALQS